MHQTSFQYQQHFIQDDGKAAANAAKLEKQNAQLKEQVASLKKAALVRS